MRPPEGRALREMERELRGRLLAHRLSESFVDRYAEDALQRGVVEYLRAREAGTEIREPTGFVLQAAFRRAIDELRREARTVEAGEVERLMEEAGHAHPSAEEIAVEDLTAADLHAAIATLPVEERQALSLHYFEELSDARSARLLYCSERTFRRRLRQALADLAERLGVPAPEPGSHRALEVGLASWVSLRGARIVPSAHLLDRLSAAVEAARHGLIGILDRLRSPAARLAGEGVPERLGAVAGGPVGKVLGGCAGAAVVCALSGVVGPGLDLGGGGGPGTPAPRVRHHQAASSRRVATRPILVEPPPVTKVEPKVTTERASDTTGTASSTPSRRGSASPAKARKKTHRETQPTEAQATEEQFSGIAQAAAESEGEYTAPEVEEAAVQEATPAQSTASSGSGGSSSEERQVEEQFRGPLAR